MNLIKIVALLITISITTDSYSCDCKDFGTLDSARMYSYTHSDIVFLGELVDFDTTDYSFTFKILEQFKGISKATLIKGKWHNTCSMFPTDRSKWIIYANIQDGGMIDISQCLASRSELNPFCIGCYKLPPPLSPHATDLEKKNCDANFMLLKEKAISDWYAEIEWLRTLKTTKQ